MSHSPMMAALEFKFKCVSRFCFQTTLVPLARVQLFHKNFDQPVTVEGSHCCFKGFVQSSRRLTWTAKSKIIVLRNGMAFSSLAVRTQVEAVPVLWTIDDHCLDSPFTTLCHRLPWRHCTWPCSQNCKGEPETILHLPLFPTFWHRTTLPQTVLVSKGLLTPKFFLKP